VLTILQEAQPLTDGHSDRRESERFPIVRDVRYKLTSHRGEHKLGIGKTVNGSRWCVGRCV